MIEINGVLSLENLSIQQISTIQDYAKWAMNRKEPLSYNRGTQTNVDTIVHFVARLFITHHHHLYFDLNIPARSLLIMCSVQRKVWVQPSEVSRINPDWQEIQMAKPATGMRDRSHAASTGYDIDPP